MKRASRRHHSDRMKAKARRVSRILGLPENHFLKQAGHLKACSCSMCCNPRRSAKGKERLTRQELSSSLVLDEAIGCSIPTHIRGECIKWLSGNQ